MGLGKSIQSIMAADILAKDGRILCLVPATLKINWQREIVKWLGVDKHTIHIVSGKECRECKHGAVMHTRGPCLAKIDIHTGKTIKLETRTNSKTKKVEKIEWRYCDCQEPPRGGPNTSARWNIVNYDIAADWYDALINLDYDVLIVDEAHFAKNRDSIRSKVIVGGKIPKLRRQTKSDKRDTSLCIVDGLAMHADRVFMLSGTPITNRVSDLFNLLRAIGHPLGRNFKYFANRYCDPTPIKGKYKTFGIDYSGASNMEELRRAVEPIFLQRKAEECLTELPGRQLSWIATEVDTREYMKVMKDYQKRREAGELSSKQDHLSILNEARMCTAMSKVPASIDRIEEALEAGKKVLVGTVSSRVAEKFIEYFSSATAEKKWGANSVVAFIGSKTDKEKQQAVDQFQDDPTKRVFVGTYTNGQSAATGLTLTKASVVLINDFDWVPSNIRQFYKRADRMGQLQFVNVIFMLAAGTFDEMLAPKLEAKVSIVNAFESVQGDLFDDLLEGLEAAPQNEEVAETFRAKLDAAKKVA